jgi:hypothetical protein
MNDDSILGGVLNQLGQTAKQTVKQVVKLPEEMAADLGKQITGEKPITSAKPDLASGELKSKQWQSDEERVKFLRDLYGKSDPSASSGQDKKPSEFQEQIAEKSPEEQKKLIELRNQLHKVNYYDPTFNPKNPPAGGEERPAEKVEQEKKQEMMDLQQKDAKKPPPLAVVREQNKAEMFRGASG